MARLSSAAYPHHTRAVDRPRAVSGQPLCHAGEWRV